MFQKRERLERAEFTHVFKTGRRHQFPHLTVITKTSETRQVSVVAGKKVAKSAVRRNQLRRRVYAVLRAVCDEMGYRGACIVLLKPSFSTLPRKTALETTRRAIAEALQSA